MITAEEKYVSMTTFTKAGDRKATPVWIADVDGDFGFTTASNAWKLRRLRNDPRCELQPCDQRGRVKEGAVVVTGKGREATPDEFAVITENIRAKYGLSVPVIEFLYRMGAVLRRREVPDRTAIVITLD